MVEFIKENFESLNPFGTGQGLSTAERRALDDIFAVSIPLEQGGVFRRSDRYVQAAQEVLIPLEQGGVFRQQSKA